MEGLASDDAATQRSLAADQEWVAKFTESYGCQSSECDERWKSRSEEIVVIHDPIKLLNDDVLELFKAKVPYPSLMQIFQSTTVVAKRALGKLRRFLRAPRCSVLAST